MRIPIRWAIVASSLSILLMTPPPALGWGNTGHEAVAYVAWQQITPAARARAIELLKQVPALHNADNSKSIPGYTEWVAELPAGLSQDEQNLYIFMWAATWPDTIKHQWLRDSNTPPKNRTTEVNIGFADKESHGYWHFIDSGFASDTSTVPATPVPNVATQIVALRQFIASNEDDVLKAYDLVWLEHLVGDVHQPLHGSTRYFAGADDAAATMSRSGSLRRCGGPLKVLFPRVRRTSCMPFGMIFRGKASRPLHCLKRQPMERAFPRLRQPRWQ